MAVLTLFSYSAFRFIKSLIAGAEKTETIELKRKTESYLGFIADGDNWLAQRKWHNAIFQYKKASEIFPNEYDINYRLAYAYSLRCENEFVDCQEGKEILDRLIKQFPEESELLQLKKILHIEYQ